MLLCKAISRVNIQVYNWWWSHLPWICNYPLLTPTLWPLHGFSFIEQFLRSGFKYKHDWLLVVIPWIGDHYLCLTFWHEIIHSKTYLFIICIKIENSKSDFYPFKFQSGLQSGPFFVFPIDQYCGSSFCKQQYYLWKTSFNWPDFFLSRKQKLVLLCAFML